MLSFVFLLLVLMTVQAALYYHARNVVKAEAEGVARRGRAYPTNNRLVDTVPSQQQVSAAANSIAVDEWNRLDGGGDTTSRPRVRLATIDNLDQLHITIEADPIVIVPVLVGGSKLTITATAGGPMEVFKRSGDN